MDVGDGKNGNQQSKDRVCLDHGREQHGFTELIRLLGYDADGSDGSSSLMVCGDQTDQRDGQAGQQVHKPGMGVRDCCSAKDADL